MVVLGLLATISKSTSVYNLKEQNKSGYRISLVISISHDKSKGDIEKLLCHAHVHQSPQTPI